MLHTFTIFKLLFNHRIVDISHDLQPHQLLLHTIYADCFLGRASASSIVHRYNLCNLDTHILNLLNLLRSVGSEYLSRLLKALVR